MRVWLVVLFVAAGLLTLAGCGTNGGVRTVTVTRVEHEAATAGDRHVTSTPIPAPSPVTTNAAPQFTACDANISARAATTTCGFAQNAFYEYWAAHGAKRLRVYSPALGRALATTCSRSANKVHCTTADSGEVVFPQAAVAAYTPTLATAYARTHDVSSPPSAPGKDTTSTTKAQTQQDGALDGPGRVCLPATHLPAVTVGSYHVPATTIPRSCFDTSGTFAPQHLGVRASDYDDLDPDYSPSLSTKYWADTPSTALPDPSAPGFGETNAAGFPRNQYVRPYMRSDGTLVNGYWRNSPTDGLPTCKIINC